MPCKLKFEWVKLPRKDLPPGKGIMGHWARLASRAAFRSGISLYCGHFNPVVPGMWSGGVVGLKSILGVRHRSEAIGILCQLSYLGFLEYRLDRETKKLDYKISDWVLSCVGKERLEGPVYASEKHGFLCLPRNITDRLVRQHYIFEEADAWLDLWCHTVHQDEDNAFSLLAPTIQYGKRQSVLTLEIIGKRWGWEKTKVWRFFKKHEDVFPLYRLPSRYGCLVFNKLYPTGSESVIPSLEDVVRILGEIRILGKDTHLGETDNEILNKQVAIYSREMVGLPPARLN